MTLIDFIQTMDISLGWTGSDSYAEIKDGKIKINVPLFLAEAIIHEHIHCTLPHTDFDKETCSSLVQKQAQYVLHKLGESALRDIANEVLKAIARGGNTNEKISQLG